MKETIDILEEFEEDFTPFTYRRKQQATNDPMYITTNTNQDYDLFQGMGYIANKNSYGFSNDGTKAVLKKNTIIYVYSSLDIRLRDEVIMRDGFFLAEEIVDYQEQGNFKIIYLIKCDTL